MSFVCFAFSFSLLRRDATRTPARACVRTRARARGTFRVQFLFSHRRPADASADRPCGRTALASAVQRVPRALRPTLRAAAFAGGRPARRPQARLPARDFAPARCERCFVPRRGRRAPRRRRRPLVASGLPRLGCGAHRLARSRVCSAVRCRRPRRGGAPPPLAVGRARRAAGARSVASLRSAYSLRCRRRCPASPADRLPRHAATARLPTQRRATGASSAADRAGAPAALRFARAPARAGASTGPKAPAARMGRKGCLTSVCVPPFAFFRSNRISTVLIGWPGYPKPALNKRSCFQWLV